MVRNRGVQTADRAQIGPVLQRQLKYLIGICLMRISSLPESSRRRREGQPTCSPELREPFMLLLPLPFLCMTFSWKEFVVSGLLPKKHIVGDKDRRMFCRFSSPFRLVVASACSDADFLLSSIMQMEFDWKGKVLRHGRDYHQFQGNPCKTEKLNPEERPYLFR